MMDLLQNYLTGAGHWHDVLSSSLSHMHIAIPMPDDWGVLAQQFKETDISGDIGKWWDKTVKSGQVWAFLLGAIFGYLAKMFTTYG